jgi:myo-inositol-1(or 4)-monophosphatase
MDLKEICREVEIVAAAAASFIMKESGKFDHSETKSKGLNDFVSYVDLGSEKILVEKLEKLIPDAGFLVEEGTSGKSGSEYCWIIDPLDGTTNFLHGLHPFSISIGLSRSDEIIAGVVYEAGGKEIFTAWKNGGAWMNGKRIRVSETNKLSDSLISTGFPYSDFSRLSSYLICIEYLMKNTNGLRRMGSAAIYLANVACGRYDGFFEYGLKPWDVAAGTILIREAGGIVSDFSGIYNVSGVNIIASNSLVNEEFLKIVSKFMVFERPEL